MKASKTVLLKKLYERAAAAVDTARHRLAGSEKLAMVSETRAALAKKSYKQAKRIAKQARRAARLARESVAQAHDAFVQAVKAEQAAGARIKREGKKASPAIVRAGPRKNITSQPPVIRGKRPSRPTAPLKKIARSGKTAET